MRNDTQARKSRLTEPVLPCRTEAVRESDEERALLLGIVEPRLDKTN
jgi:hypothetical protein